MNGHHRAALILSINRAMPGFFMTPRWDFCYTGFLKVTMAFEYERLARTGYRNQSGTDI